MSFSIETKRVPAVAGVAGLIEPSQPVLEIKGIIRDQREAASFLRALEGAAESLPERR